MKQFKQFIKVLLLCVFFNIFDTYTFSVVQAQKSYQQKYFLSFCSTCHQNNFLIQNKETIISWYDLKNLSKNKNHIMYQLRKGYTQNEWQNIIDAVKGLENLNKK